VGAVANPGWRRGPFGLADGVGGEALFNYPDGVAIDASGTIFVADHDNQTIRKVTTAGAVTTLAGAAKTRAAPMVPAARRVSTVRPAWRSMAPATSMWSTLAIPPFAR